MRLTRVFIFCATLSAFSSGSAGAATVICPLGGDGVSIGLITTTAVSCSLSGDGNVLTGSNDPINHLGYLTLDTTRSSGPVTLTFSGTVGGNFSFTPVSNYDHYVLGIQTAAASPKPDYFSFILPASVSSGSWFIDDGGETRVTLAVLYGIDPPTAAPLPAALPLFASGLGALGLLGWRRKRKAAAIAAA